MLGWFSGKSPGYFGDTAAVSVGQVVHPITQPGLQLVHLGWFGNHEVDLTFRDGFDIPRCAKKTEAYVFLNPVSKLHHVSPFISQHLGNT